MPASTSVAPYRPSFARRRMRLVNKQFQLRYLLMAISVVIILVNVTAILSFLIAGPPASGRLPWLEVGLLGVLTESR